MIYIASLFFVTATLTPNQAMEIGVKVWQNECAGTLEGLTCWNEGEEFASLGIGHFIWYPPHKNGPYIATFPELVRFLAEKGVNIPRWLLEAHGCPWKNREQFRRALQIHSKQMMEIRRLLQNTIELQAQFLHLRLERALPSLLAAVPDEKKNKIQTLYERVCAHPNGHYALLDYVNFKGYGTSEGERYNGWGWGLYQVLDNMVDDLQTDSVQAFVDSAKKILEQRISNAPSIRNEQRYLNGWYHRLDSYLAK
ncbi:MAG: hypothetical protein HW387_592 [Parachlamydiales bacterium]|nr:hypothetical protein [Parachlamydiales bacterium]